MTLLFSAAQLQRGSDPRQQRVLARRQRLQVGQALLQRRRRLLHVASGRLPSQSGQIRRVRTPGRHSGRSWTRRTRRPALAPVRPALDHDQRSPICIR